MKTRMWILVPFIIPSVSTSMMVCASFTRVMTSDFRSDFKRRQQQQRVFKNVLRHFVLESQDEFKRWRKIDWLSLSNEYEAQREASMTEVERENWRKACTTLSKDYLKSVLSPLPSPIEAILVDSKRILIKRDDLLRLERSNVNGNKARKVLALSEMLTDEEFPEAVVSYGGPQSNAMLAIAAVVASKNEKMDINDGNRKRFIYYTKKLPRYLRKQPNGNLLRAQSLGMELIELPNDRYQELFGGSNGGPVVPPVDIEPPEQDSIWIPQGGAFQAAIPGAKRLAKEICLFWDAKGEGPLCIVVPCGTGTTALLLQHELDNLRVTNSHRISVVAVPCVGDDDYLQRQMTSLSKAIGESEKSVPEILRPKATFASGKSSKRNGYFVFGEPSSDLLNTFNKMKNEGVFVDLLYGAPTWTFLLQHLQDVNRNKMSPLYGAQIMYLHSGGLEGISSQLTRYRHKGLISAEEVQAL